MSIFSTILKAIGLGADAPPAEAPKAAAPKASGKVPDVAKYTQVKRSPMAEVDLAQKLDAMAEAKGQDKKNWRVSIVEMLNLLGIDSSHANRVELAKELGISDDLMGGDSAAMNIWLHKEVMKKIAANGGIVPKELLD